MDDAESNRPRAAEGQDACAVGDVLQQERANGRSHCVPGLSERSFSEDIKGCQARPAQGSLGV